MTGSLPPPGTEHPSSASPSATDWVAVPPGPAAYGSAGGWHQPTPGWSSGGPTWTPEPVRAPARPAESRRGRVALIALVGAVAGAAVASVVVASLFLAGARETGEAMGDEIADQLAEDLGMDLGWSTDPLPAPGASAPVEQSAPVAPGVLGPDPVLDAYAQQCFAGDLQSCDDLFYSSAPGRTTRSTARPAGVGSSPPPSTPAPNSTDRRHLDVPTTVRAAAPVGTTAVAG